MHPFIKDLNMIIGKKIKRIRARKPRRSDNF